jgi:hypothetical protein
MLKQTILGALIAAAAFAVPQTSTAQSGSRADPSRYQYRDRNGEVHWDRAGWRRAEEIRKQRELVRKRELQRQHQAEQQREREQRQRAERQLARRH